MSEETKITSAEKSKDPKRIEAGKKLGAISRQAKEKKASVRKVESEFQISNLANVDPLTAIGVVGVVGMVAYYGYYRNRKSSKNPVEAEPKDCEEPKASAEPKDREDREDPVKPKRVYRQLDTLG